MSMIELILKIGKVGVYCIYDSTIEGERYTVILQDKTAYNITICDHNEGLDIEEIELKY